MAVIQEIRDLLRWNFRRARYVVRTEGVAILAQRSAETAGIAQRAQIPPQPLLQPTPAPSEPTRWPVSVLVLSNGGPRTAEFARLDLPVLLRPAEGADTTAAQQLVSVLYVLGRANWPSVEVLDAARQLRQTVVLEVLASDSAADLPPCDAIVVAADRDLATTVTVHVVPPGGQALTDLLHQVSP